MSRSVYLVTGQITVVWDIAAVAAWAMTCTLMARDVWVRERKELLTEFPAASLMC